MSPILLVILKSIAPAIIGPAVTWLVKRLVTQLPADWAPAVSAAAGAAAAVLTGDVATAGTTAAEVVSGAVAGLAGSKGRDILTGKTRSVTPEDFRPAGVE